MFSTDDTIVALSTAAGTAARAVVRMAGDRAISITRQIAPRAVLAGGWAEHAEVRTSLGPVPAVLYVFGAPNSYTGDDIVELHVPSNAILIDDLLRQCRSHGARPAGPGEFTARAFLRGRIGLVEAEGVALTIAASNAAELAAARRLLAGELARRLRPAVERLTALLALVEAEIDFSEEDATFFEPGELREGVAALALNLQSLRTEAPRIEQLGRPPRVVLVGRPNAGKSTLLNALAGHERAIASPVAGTTRDALAVDLALPGGVVTLIDLAGLDATFDMTVPRQIQRAMQDRLHDEIEKADVVVLVRDITDDRPPPRVARAYGVIVHTKIDLPHGEPARVDGPCSDTATSSDAPIELCVSATTGRGMPELADVLSRAAFERRDGSGLALSSRHRGDLDAAVAALDAAGRAIDIGVGPELIAADLRAALDALGRVTGQITPDDVLDHVFGKFCIGK